MTLLETLIRLRDNGPPEPVCGICGNASQLSGNGSFTCRVARLAEDWPDSSGVYCYPVEGSAGKYESDEGRDNRWNRAHLYGRRRYMLLNWLIATLEAQQ